MKWKQLTTILLIGMFLNDFLIELDSSWWASSTVKSLIITLTSNMKVWIWWFPAIVDYSSTPIIRLFKRKISRITCFSDARWEAQTCHMNQSPLELWCRTLHIFSLSIFSAKLFLHMKDFIAISVLKFSLTWKQYIFSRESELLHNIIN